MGLQTVTAPDDGVNTRVPSIASDSTRLLLGPNGKVLRVVTLVRRSGRPLRYRNPTRRLAPLRSYASVTPDRRLSTATGSLQ